MWVPLGNLNFVLTPEAATCYPARPARCCSIPTATRFASRAGHFAGNRLRTLIGDLAALADIGREVLWKAHEKSRLNSLEPGPENVARGPNAAVSDP
jgi:hypothetical protein